MIRRPARFVVLAVVGAALISALAGCAGTGRTTPATEVKATSATLNGTATYSGHGTYWFEYRRNGTESWQETPQRFYGNVGASCPTDQEIPISPRENVSNLISASDYEFRLVGTNCSDLNRRWIFDSSGEVGANPSGANWSSFDTLPSDRVANATPRQNALLADGTYLPLYAVENDDATTEIAFTIRQGNIEVLDQNGVDLPGSTPVPLGFVGWSGGFDFDQDGWPDLAVVNQAYAGRNCTMGGEPVYDRAVTLYTGNGLNPKPSPVPSLSNCDHRTPPNPTYYERWPADGTSLLFGSGRELAFAPVYYGQGWFARYSSSSGSWSGDAFYQPSGLWWGPQSSGGLYAAASSPNSVYGNQTPVFNGLIKKVSGTKQLIAWTLQRVMDFKPNSPLNASQLLQERPYISSPYTGIPAPNIPLGPCCPQHAGRHYGLVASDPANQRVYLLAGTDASTVFDDLRTNSICTNPRTQGEKDCWGGLERHVSAYVPSSNNIQDRYYSISADDGSGSIDTAAEIQSWYRGRIVYPANPIIRTGSGASRIAYNVYNHPGDGGGGHWNLHISQPGSPNDSQYLLDIFLWDIRDIDGDGTDEWVTSPMCIPRPCSGSGWYFPMKRIQIYQWNESTQLLTHERTIQGVFPYLTETFRKQDVTTSKGYLYPVLTVNSGGEPKLLVTTNGTNPQPEP